MVYIPAVLTKESILDALKSVKYPGYSRDIVSFGLVKNVALHQGEVTVSIQLSAPNADAAQQIKREAELILQRLPEIKTARVDVLMPSPQQAGAAGPFAGQSRVPGIQRVVAVASGKGGVGKSTVAVNLACALRQLGATVGLLDCDIYGPSVPLMMGVNEKPSVTEDEKLLPLENHGVKLMSMGFLLEGDQPVIWRGPMIVKTIQ